MPINYYHESRFSQPWCLNSNLLTILLSVFSRKNRITYNVTFCLFVLSVFQSFSALGWFSSIHTHPMQGDDPSCPTISIYQHISRDQHLLPLRRKTWSEIFRLRKSRRRRLGLNSGLLGWEAITLATTPPAPLYYILFYSQKYNLNASKMFQNRSLKE